MIGIIESTRTSKSGATLGVKIGGTYYTTKNWELAQMAGKEITFEPSPDEREGSTTIWLNKYSVSGTQPTPAAAAMDQAMSQHHIPASGEGDHGTPQPSATPDKDSLIGAMALTKACAPVDATAVWANFLYFYAQLKGWNPNEPF